MKIGDNKVAYCDCGRRIGPTDQIGDTTECDVCNEKTEWAKDKTFLRALREQHEEKLEYENKLSRFQATYPDKVSVGTSNHIRAEVMQKEGSAPFVMITMMVGNSGKYIEYSYQQFEGLMVLLEQVRTELRGKL